MLMFLFKTKWRDCKNESHDDFTEGLPSGGATILKFNDNPILHRVILTILSYLAAMNYSLILTNSDNEVEIKGFKLPQEVLPPDW